MLVILDGELLGPDPLLEPPPPRLIIITPPLRAGAAEMAEDARAELWETKLPPAGTAGTKASVLAQSAPAPTRAVANFIGIPVLVVREE